jgi:hypothetical protein
MAHQRKCNVAKAPYLIGNEELRLPLECHVFANMKVFSSVPRLALHYLNGYITEQVICKRMALTLDSAKYIPLREVFSLTILNFCFRRW